MVQQITETARVIEGQSSKTGEFPIQVITPGWGSSGYYSTSVAEQAAPLVTVGTHMYVDHPTATEAEERPERSIRDIAAYVVEAGSWDADRQAVVATCRFTPAYAPLAEDAEFLKTIGLSIRGSATDVTEGEAEGRRGRIIEGLHSIDSVDLVTRAGRGGKFLSLMESVRTNARAIGHGVAEATVNDRREALEDLLKTAYSTTGEIRTWVWLRDFDETTAWFEVEAGDNAGTWQQTYTSTDGNPSALTGDRIEVRQVTNYVPVHPAGQLNTQESKEDTMATTQIEESALTDLREKAGRVTVLESELVTEKTRADKAEGDLAEARTVIAGARMRELIAEADVDFTDLEADGLAVKAKVDESGVLDEEAFKAIVAEAAAKIAEANGAGTPRLNGRRTSTTSTTEVSESDLDALDDAIFGVVKEA